MRRASRPTPPTAAHPIELTIEEIGAHGDGVAYRNGGPVFVPYTLPGDRVVARPVGSNHAVPQSWSARGVAPQPARCSHFGTCGGCALQHLDDKTYVAWKRQQLEIALSRRGIHDVDIRPVLRAAPQERRRADFGVLRMGGRVELGFHGYRSPRLVDMRDCAVLEPAIVALLPALRGLMRDLLGDRQAADLLITRTESGVDVLIGRFPEPDRGARERVAAFAATHDLARVARRRASETPEILIQRREPHTTFGDVAVDIPPGAFLQATKSGEHAIVAAAHDAIAGAKRIADLYAGCGTLTFPLAGAARVHAVEGAPALADALSAAARRAGYAGRVTVETRDLNRRPLLADEMGAFDAVVFDPPREGAAEQTAEIARSKVKTAVGVSCNPATFARDARVLIDAGFRLEGVAPVDQFLWSPHLELVGVFRR
jgi:23S rRNA (uracil1939-C5)-methyltransferase